MSHWREWSGPDECRHRQIVGPQHWVGSGALPNAQSASSDCSHECLER